MKTLNKIQNLFRKTSALQTAVEHAHRQIQSLEISKKIIQKQIDRYTEKISNLEAQITKNKNHD
jgi:hypothetical protein